MGPKERTIPELHAACSLPKPGLLSRGLGFRVWGLDTTEQRQGLGARRRTAKTPASKTPGDATSTKFAAFLQLGFRV